MAADKIDTIVSLSKRRGFVYPCSEIYGGQKAAWDYGPLGVELKENIKRQWWRYMVTSREDVVGIDRSRLDRPLRPYILHELHLTAAGGAAGSAVL